jgi:hypothetical protein
MPLRKTSLELSILPRTVHTSSDMAAVTLGVDLRNLPQDHSGQRTLKAYVERIPSGASETGMISLVSIQDSKLVRGSTDNQCWWSSTRRIQKLDGQM